MTEDDVWISAGLYEPGAPNASERLALLHYLRDLGVDVDTMVDYHRRGHLGRAAPDHVVRPTATMTVEEASRASGLTVEQVGRAWLSVGFPPPERGVVAFAPEDVVILAAFKLGLDVLGEDGILQLARVLGASLGRIAEAAVASFLVNVEAPAVAEGSGPLERAQMSVNGVSQLLGLPDVFPGLFRRHVIAAIERTRAREDPQVFDSFRMTVGFLDLVGYTAWSATLTNQQLATAISEFEERAADRVAAAGGRVVKSIGDAVMFITLDPATACDVALDLCDYVHQNPKLTEVRAAVVTGDVLARDGDYIGPTVNLAARLCKVAAPGTLVSDRPVDGFHAHELDVAPLRGIDEPSDVWQLERVPGDARNP